MSIIEKPETKVAVLAGGSSDEREISLASGQNVVNALREAGYGCVELLDPADKTFIEKISHGGYTVAFIALHGLGGEDGRIQHVLEFLGIPYTGSNALASGIAMDKELSKLLYARAGLPITPSISFTCETVPSIEELIATVGEEAFVKPAGNGSSYGISAVHNSEELEDAIEKAFTYDHKVMVEKRLFGTEISCGVLGHDDTLRALPVVEVCIPKSSDFYDLEVKYIDPSEVHRIPAQLPSNIYEEVQKLACKAHQALGLYGISRTDMIVTKDGPVLLETNNIPGMTPTSLIPDEARHAGIAFSDVCSELVDLALMRNAANMPAHSTSH